MEAGAIAKRVRAFRKLKGYTQIELSEMMNMSIAILGSIERGTRNPDEKVLRKIAEVLGISIEELRGPVHD